MVETAMVHAMNKSVDSVSKFQFKPDTLEQCFPTLIPRRNTYLFVSQGTPTHAGVYEREVDGGERKSIIDEFL